MKILVLLLIFCSSTAFSVGYDASGLPITVVTATQTETSTNAVYIPTYLKLEYAVRGETPILKVSGRVTVVDGNTVGNREFKCDNMDEVELILGKDQLDQMLLQFGAMMKKFLE